MSNIAPSSGGSSYIGQLDAYQWASKMQDGAKVSGEYCSPIVAHGSGPWASLSVSEWATTCLENNQ